MRLHLLIIAIALSGSIKTVCAQSGNSKTPMDTLVMDTMRQNMTFERKLGLQAGSSLFSCEVIYSSKGEIFRMDCVPKFSGDNFWAFVEKKVAHGRWANLKRGDILLFDKIVTVDKDGNKGKSSDKSFWIP